MRQHKGESLRDKEAEYDISKQNAIDHKGGGMTVLELMTKYVAIKSKDMRETTRKGYQTQLNLMRENKTAIQMASKRIRDVNAVDAEEWMMDLHKVEVLSLFIVNCLRNGGYRRREKGGQSV